MANDMWSCPSCQGDVTTEEWPDHKHSRPDDALRDLFALEQQLRTDK